MQRSIALLPLLVAADLLVTHRAENPSTTLAAAHDDAFPEAAGWLRAHLRPGERYVNDVHADHALHNSGLLWDLPGTSGYSSLPLWRYLHLLWISNHGRVYPHAQLHDDLSAQGLWRFDSPVVDLLAVRWVLARPGFDPRAAGYVKRFAGRDGLDVWENLEAGPGAFFVEERRLVATPDAARFVADVAARGGRFERHAVEPPRAPPGGTAAPLPDVPAAIERPSPTEIVLRVEAPVEGELVVVEPAHPGWRATVDGAAATVDTVDYALVGVRVGPGRHVVRLRMAARPVELGLGLGALGLALCVGLVLAGRRS